MTITISLWLLIPIVITVMLLIAMFRPLESKGGGDYNFGPALEAIGRMFYWIPILFTWLIYFIIF